MAASHARVDPFLPCARYDRKRATQNDVKLSSCAHACQWHSPFVSGMRSIVQGPDRPRTPR
eukprot:2982249-Pleurochrysis_carterae.AAC.1